MGEGRKTPRRGLTPQSKLAGHSTRVVTMAPFADDGSMSDTPPYGTGDASYQAAGGIIGLRRLVDDFYRLMDERPEATALRALHPTDLSASRDKLACFLSGWLGGPRLFAEKYGSISIP